MKWRIQFLFLVAAMACLVLGGIHLAERGIQRVEGIQNGPSQSFEITRLENNQMEMTVLGKEYSLESDTLLPVVETLTMFSSSTQEEASGSIGNWMGNWITTISRYITNELAE